MKSQQSGIPSAKRILRFSKRLQYFLITFFFLAIATNISAQADITTKEEEDALFGKGGKKETKSIYYADGVKEKIERHFDSTGRVRRYIQTTTEKNGDISIDTTGYDCNGRKIYSQVIRKDSAGKEKFYSIERFSGDKENKIISGYRMEKNASGDSTIFDFDSRSGKYYERDPKKLPEELGPTFKLPDPYYCPDEDYDEEDDYDYMVNLSGGYSHLLANFKPENEGLSGWFATAFYNFNPRWSVGLFTSGHYKSPENQQFSMYFFHGALKYDLGNQDRKANRFNPYISLGLGISTFKSEISIPGFPKFESDDKSFTPFFGAGIDMEILKNMILKADASYVPTHFQDDTQHNLRFSAGIGLGIFRVQRQFPVGD